MLRIDIPNIAFDQETERTIRRIFASKGLPGGQPHDSFVYEDRPRHEMRVWADAVWTGVLSCCRFVIGEERKRNNPAFRLANLEQAFLNILQQVRDDATIHAERVPLECMRRAYKLGIGQTEMLKALGPSLEAGHAYAVSDAECVADARRMLAEGMDEVDVDEAINTSKSDMERVYWQSILANMRNIAQVESAAENGLMPG